MLYNLNKDKKSEDSDKEEEELEQREKPSLDTRDDPIIKIHNEELFKRICQPRKTEDQFDILLSGTSVTLAILTQDPKMSNQRSLHTAWVGDSPLLLLDKNS